jgi:hypothetical protein
MHLACIKGDLEIFKLLVDSCSLANEQVDVYNMTPLEYGT